MKTYLYLLSSLLLTGSFALQARHRIPPEHPINDTLHLEEVIVTGYATTGKHAFTGTATTVSGHALLRLTDANPIKSLEGRVPGLSLNTTSGQPGAPVMLYIRGRSSYQAGTQPLYVVDGVPIESAVMGFRKSTGQALSPLSGIAPADIESITVLKDAVATAIYGTRAANGVVVINTRKGHAGKTAVNLYLKSGFETMPAFPGDFHLLNRDEYMELMTEGLVNRYGVSKEQAQQSIYKNFRLDPSKESPDVDWLEEVTRRGRIYNAGIGINGGGEHETAAHYYLSFDYYKNEAMVTGKDLTRYSGRFNLDHTPRPFIQYGINSSFSYTDVNMGNKGGNLTDPITLAYMRVTPLIAVHTPEGDWNFSNTSYNPAAIRSKNGDLGNGKQYQGLISPYLSLRIMPRLKFTTRGGIHLYALKEFGYRSFLNSQSKKLNGMGEQSTTTRTHLGITNTLHWTPDFSSHHLNLLFGQEIYHIRDNSSFLYATNYPVEHLNQISLAASPGDASTSLDNLSLASFFFDTQYHYQHKYFISAGIRTDGSSRFGANHRWALFYALGVRYRLSAEPFMGALSGWLDDLTVRLSYGTSGNQDVGGSWHASEGLYDFGHNYNNQPGSYRKQAGNPDLKWEQTSKFNAGLTLALWKKRLQLETDFYRHYTTDMVFEVPVSRVTGLENIPENIGEMENRGIEFSLSALLLRTTRCHWSLTLTGSHNRIRVRRLNSDRPIENNITSIEAGRDIYTFKMKEWAGVDPQTGNPQWWTVHPDGSREKTSNYNKATAQYLGTASPKFEGSFSSDLTIRNFDFSFQLVTSLGYKVYNDALRYTEHCGNSGYWNVSRYVYKHRWQTPGQLTDVPRFVYGNTSGASNASSRFLMDGDYFRLRNITLGYTIPEQFLEKLRLTSLRFYISCDNLLTLTASGYRGFDPATGPAGHIQFWDYPAPRNFLFGLQLNF